MTSKSFLQLSGGVCFLALTTLLGVVAYQAAILPQTASAALISRVDTAVAAVGKRLDARDRQIEALLKNVNQFVDDTYNDNYANVESTTVILHEAAEILAEVRRKVLPDVEALLTQAEGLMHSVQSDVDTLTQSTDRTLASLRPMLDNAAQLLDTLDTQIKQGSPEVAQTIVKLNKILDDVEVLSSDPNIAKTLAHVEGTTESVDTIMKRVAGKVGALKAILRTALSVVKVNFP